MHRDEQREAGFKSSRQHGRKEWAPVREPRHPREAREHVRETGKSRRTHELLAADAERQIREIAARFSQGPR